MQTKIPILLVLLFVAAVKPVAHLPPGAGPPVRLKSPKDSIATMNMVRTSAAFASSPILSEQAVIVPPPAIYTNVILSFDPAPAPASSYQLTYEGDNKKGVIDMGTNTSVLITNYNLAASYTLRAWSFNGPAKSRTATELKVPAWNQISGVGKSNGWEVTWFGVSNKTYTIQSTTNLSNWLNRTNIAGTGWWQQWTDAVSSRMNYYRTRTQ